MFFSPPLIKGHLIKRYKRFLAEIQLTTGEVIVAHCPNPGAMLGLNSPGTVVWLQPVFQKKLPYSWCLVEDRFTLIGINTLLPNRLIKNALINSKLVPFDQYTTIQTEVKFGLNTRFDFLLTASNGSQCYMEIKNAHLKRQHNLAEFPDCKTTRGVKHLQELINVRRQGHRACLLYVVQRTDCHFFQVADDLDSAYAAACQQAKEQGIEFMAVDCRISTQEIELNKWLEIKWS